MTGGPDLTYNGGNDAFVAKVIAAGTSLDLLRLHRRLRRRPGAGIAVDSSGNAYVAGYTELDRGHLPGDRRAGPDLQRRHLRCLRGQGGGVRPDTGTAIWRNAGDNTPEVSDWDGTDFVGTPGAADMGEWRIVEAAEAPARDEIIAVGVDNIAFVKGQIWNGLTWTALPFNWLAVTGDTTDQGFDVAYESLSGDAILVWNNGAGGRRVSHTVSGTAPPGPTKPRSRPTLAWPGVAGSQPHR